MNDTYRTRCGGGRVSYHPEWDKERPWAVYFHGTAILHARTARDGLEMLRRPRLLGPSACFDREVAE